MATNKEIPEIITQIGTHLDPPHLYSAIRVCRSWNIALIPKLWTSIDDSLYSWNFILDSFLNIRRMDPSDGSGVEWARRVFLKYGHLVQNLRIRRREILDAMCCTQACTMLKTLRIGKIKPGGFQELEHEWMYDLSPEEQAEMAGIRWQDAMEGIVDSVTFQQVFEPRSLDLSKITLAQMEVDWEVTRGFWMLLKENRDLQVLRLDESLTLFMDLVSSEYFIEILRSLRELRELENDFVQVELAAIMQAVPKLRRYVNLTDPCGPLSLTEPAQRLIHVELNRSTPCQELFQFLRNAPNLESLSIRCLNHIAPMFSYQESELLMDDIYSGLERLQIGTFMGNNGYLLDKRLLDTMLPWMPALKTIHLTRLHVNLVRSFSEHCSALTTVEGSNVGPILQLTPGRWQENHEAKSLEELIMTCPALEKIDWIGRTLCDKTLWDYTGVWPNLTFLRCQIGGLKVLPIEFEAIWKQIKGLPGPFRFKENRVFLQQESIRQQQRLVLSRIGSLRNLKTLDIGADFQLHENTTWAKGGQGGSWVDRKRPRMYDCLRLSLEMGLEELAGLKNLEVFGFEGIEHEIGEAELGWMSESWKKLKVMRGLCSTEGSLLVETEEDMRKARLLGVMKMLRPDVVHESSGVCVMVPLR
ncbi:hypothetical protein BGZ47_003987 [Haplosporangium gracile]|nr:hypothetical protein BGZ47_003987 [Haplosporangium gracile]